MVLAGDAPISCSIEHDPVAETEDEAEADYIDDNTSEDLDRRDGRSPLPNCFPHLGPVTS